MKTREPLIPTREHLIEEKLRTSRVRRRRSSRSTKNLRGAEQQRTGRKWEMQGTLVQLPHRQQAAAAVAAAGGGGGGMVGRPVGFLRFPGPLLSSMSTGARVTVRLPSSPRCASSSSLNPADDSSGAPASTSSVEKRSSPWLFVGLGNPGSKYQGTRHNVGFDMIDAIAQTEGISLSTIQFKALLGKGQIGGSPVLLAKPQTYMNLSGESVKPLASYYKIPPERVLAIYDDLDLEFAVMKLLPKGGHGGHNGMRSILQHFHSRDIARLRIVSNDVDLDFHSAFSSYLHYIFYTSFILHLHGDPSPAMCFTPHIPAGMPQGIGRPPGQMDTQAYVLQRFSSSEREELDFALDRGVEAIRLVTSEGLVKAVSTWNQVRKSKISKMKYSVINVD